MYGWHEKLWVVMSVVVAIGIACVWFVTRAPEAMQAAASPALSTEPNAALIDTYLAQIRAGLTAYRTQQFVAATQAFAAAATLQPSEPLAYRYLAELHWRAGRPEQAQQAVHSLAGVVRDAYALDQMGRTYEEAELNGLAIRVYQEAVRLDPEFPGAHYNLGRIYLEAGNLGQGIAEMQAALRLHPDFPEAHQALGMAYSEQGRVDDAIVHLERALALSPDLTVVRNQLGRMYLAKGRLQEAVQTFQSLVERAPELAEARHNLAVAYARLKLRDRAIEQFKAALRLQPNFQAARLDLATLLLEMGRAHEAIDVLREGIAAASPQSQEGDPVDLVDLHYRLGIAHQLAGQPQEAIHELQAVLAAQPEHAGAQARLGVLYYQSRQFDRAWRYARRAESLGAPVAELLAALRRVSVEPR